jgi:plastocyanin
MTASITAKDPYSFDNGSGASSVSVARGGTVTFSYPSGASFHNVVFDTAQPTACQDMPSGAAPPGWSGSCSFDAYGTYAFHCGLHSLMTGRVEVPDPSAPPTGTTGPTDPTGPTGPTGPPPTETGGELAPPAVKMSRRQSGTVVRGSVTTPAGPSTVAVTALVGKRALASRARLVKVGALKKHSAGTGRTSFALRIDRGARRALHRHHRLALTVRIAVAPDAGTAFKKTAKVVLREKS